MNAIRLSIKLLAGALVVVLALTGALWLWGGTDSSLATLLTRFQRFLPSDQVFEAKEVQGSLRNGGHIGWLRWRRGGLSVEAKDVGVAWTLRPLLNGSLRLRQLTVASLTIDDQRPSASHTQPTPPSDLRLPITLDVPFTVATVTWTGATALQATQLSGRYIFDSYSHRLIEGKGQLSSGSYQLSGELQAVAPMALALHLSGAVQTTVPSSHQPLTVAATAQLTGSLAGPDATLALQATLQPDLATGKTTPKGKPAAMQATLSASIQPWHTQPLTQASGQWQALDLAALWPQAPQTLLTGEASVVPAGEGWQGKVMLTNTLPGPWNQQRLPLNTLRADVDHVQGQWALRSMQATGAGGTATGSGKFDAGLWQGSVQLQGVNPAAIDSRLASAPMRGTLSAQQTASSLGFATQLQAMPGAAKPQNLPRRPNSLQALQLQSLQAQGEWTAPQLTLRSLDINAHDAKLQGKLAYNTTTQAAQGQLALTLPGMNGTLDGLLASHDGKGTLAVSVADAALATRWLSRWPDLAPALSAGSLQGSAQLEASWQGGWRNQGHDLRVNASLRAPQLGWAASAPANTTPASPWQLRDLQADLAGTLPALQFSTQGKATTGTRQVDWQLQANAGKINADHWQGSLGQFKVNAQDSARPGIWTLVSGNPGGKAITLDWLQSSQTQALSIGSGGAQLTGPMAGTAQLSWEPARWSAQRVTSPAQAKAQWQSQGHISNLPLAWLDALSGKSMADLGLSSDLILAGSWDAKHTDTLHLGAMLERSSGDLRLRADNSRQLVLPADMKEARLQVNLDDGYLSSSLRWDSTRAGKALMAFSTRLKALDTGWTLAGDAAVGGGLQIQMPPVDAWSVLAPPGWRLRGTMNADVTLGGTLDVPQWNGSLQARDLAVRSVVDGIDFNQGSLNVRLHEQQLDIQDFTLQGATSATGASGGQLSMTGSVFWVASSAQANLLSHFRMALELQAKSLRVNNRSDRRLMASGKVSAQLKDARLTLRGALAADQAMITLPDDSAPQLGDDVVVHSRAAKTAAKTPQKPATSAGAGPRLTPDVRLDLDLGPDFQVRGRGLEARLAGKLELQSLDGNAPTLTGTVRTVRGTYQAYGQRLDIEQGVLRFFGPADNPALDILAIRPKLTQRVGVQLLGTALSPVVRLYAEPDLPEAEKLAWLVLGRSASGSGGEAALLQQAALALLGGGGKGPSASLTQALGLDELSFRGNTGTTTSATLTIGKRLSNDFYVTYESGLAGTVGVFSIFYDLSRRLTLRAQTGEQSTVDLIWTQRYD